MEEVCQEIGIHWQHVSETSVPRRYHLICDKKWLQMLEQKQLITTFPVCENLDRRAHPAKKYLPHPWTKVLVQIYEKRPLMGNCDINVVKQLWNRSEVKRSDYIASAATSVTTLLSMDDAIADFEDDDTFLRTPLSYSQAVYEVTKTNFRNAWKMAYNKYSGAHNIGNSNSHNDCNYGNVLHSKSDLNLQSHDVLLQEIVQRVFRCPIIHCKIDREQNDLLDNNGMVQNQGNEDSSRHKRSKSYGNQHSNIMSALIAIETTSYIAVIFYPTCLQTTLYDCITFSPSVLSRSYNKPLFIIYQLFHVLKYLQKLGLLLGALSLQDIFMGENLWIKVIPHIESNIIIIDSVIHNRVLDSIEKKQEISEHLNKTDINRPVGDSFCRIRNKCDVLSNEKLDLNLIHDLGQFNLKDYCELWCNGYLSNYDYLTVLNNACGRSLTNPAYHHVMPWVTDFTSRSGLNWRDLTKSKYRLNKGDTHLDLMFTHCGQTQLYRHKANSNPAFTGSVHVPHHVSDFLSDITYFVYTARRTPQHILREHVRPIWVPAEYPVSIQRLQEWTPDECIPEFYSNPMIFKSIHEDLPDLEIPTWATCPEDFIVKHREALESQYVDERLHHWIDLNFGFKLTGKAAIKSKNVCLSMVDKHKNLCQRGIVQLFTHPHPSKYLINMTWFGPQAPRLQHLYQKNSKQRKSESSSIKSDGKYIGIDYQRLARSTENLSQGSIGLSIAKSPVPPLATPSSPSIHSTSSYGFISPIENQTNSVHVKSKNLAVKSNRNDNSVDLNNESIGSDSTTNSTLYRNTNCIELPKDYNPLSLLLSLETTKIFLNKTFPKQQPTRNATERLYNSDLLFDNYSADHSFTNQLFNEPRNYPTRAKCQLHYEKLINTKLKFQSIDKYLELEAMERKQNDLRIMGCIIVEIFAMNRLRPLVHLLQSDGSKEKLNERIKSCQIIKQLHKNDIPKSLLSICDTLLNCNYSDKSMSLRNDFLSSPTASQILQNIYQQILLPFPKEYYQCYGLLRSLHSYDEIIVLLDLYTHFNCNGMDCKKYCDLDSKRICFESKIAECQVTSCYALIRGLLSQREYLHPSLLSNEQFPIIDLILPHIIDLLNNPHTSIFTAWHLFDPVAQSLGRFQTERYLLRPILKLYDHTENFQSEQQHQHNFMKSSINLQHNMQNARIQEKVLNTNKSEQQQQACWISSTVKSRKSIKLYHHSFLLRLIVRFGLKSFLNNFITPLIEAVGGYKDADISSNGMHCHHHLTTEMDSVTGVSSNIIETNNSNIYMKNESFLQKTGSSIESTINKDTDKNENSEAKMIIEDVFSFDEEEVDDHDDDSNIDRSRHFNKSIESLDMLKTSASMAEEAMERQHQPFTDLEHPQNYDSDLGTSTEGFAAISELMYGIKLSSNSLEDNLPINRSSMARSHNIAIPLNVVDKAQQLNAIDCDIGSRKSMDSIDLQIQNDAPFPQVDRNLSFDENTVGMDRLCSQSKQSDINEVNPELTDPATDSSNKKLPKLPKSKKKTEKDNTAEEIYSNNVKLFACNNGSHRIAEMCGESLVWLSHRLGPVLTSRFITKNLLKMLTLCYVGQENLLPRVETQFIASNSFNCKESYHKKLQHFSVSDGRVNGDRSAAYILECLMSIASLYGEKMVLLQYMPHITEVIASGIKRISGNLEGAIISTLQLTKYLIPCLRDETIMEHLDEIFLDAIIIPILNFIGSTNIQMPSGYLGRSTLTRKLLDIIYILGLRIGADMTRERLCTNVIRPFFLIFDKTIEKIDLNDKLSDEISDVFCSALAHTAYLIFLRFLGEQTMRKTLMNFELVISLCHDYEEPLNTSATVDQNISNNSIMSNSHLLDGVSNTCSVIRCNNEDNSSSLAINNSFGRQVIGNRIEIPMSTSNSHAQLNESIKSRDMLDLVSYKFEELPTSRYLKGNWLAYWRHEITRSDKEETLNLKQIKLQSFIGHTNSVRAIHTLDNENSFISASKVSRVYLKQN